MEQVAREKGIAKGKGGMEGERRDMKASREVTKSINGKVHNKEKDEGEGEKEIQLWHS